MSQEAPSVAVQGNFGRVAVHATARALVEHAHQEFNFIFHLMRFTCCKVV